MAATGNVRISELPKHNNVDGKEIIPVSWQDDGSIYTSYHMSVNDLKSYIGGGAQADWNETVTTDPAYILNKPVLGTASAKDYIDSVTQGSSDLITSGATYTALADTEYVMTEAINNIKSTYIDPLGTAANKDYTTTLEQGSADLITSGAAYTSVSNMERIVATAINEMKTTYVDPLYRDAFKQEILYYVANNIISYLRSQNIYLEYHTVESE